MISFYQSEAHFYWFMNSHDPLGLQFLRIISGRIHFSDDQSTIFTLRVSPLFIQLVLLLNFASTFILIGHDLPIGQHGRSQALATLGTSDHVVTRAAERILFLSK